ncbi:hypothetical protein PRK78_000894 [Emydomyces testavorans]|uniref:Uncharacterized protein n=1 Tax=Emydomyces testavorans TaxID=2070801 RepID=A0AAF0DBY7_9EURO|nr:hypothetical protein PRK78_000894 [Emydomyces testavorans]
MERQPQSSSHSRSSSSGFRSRRSYPNLQHISLAPLTSRFPLDDDDGDASRKEGDYPPSMSYYSTTSVPATPPVLSDSRNVSSTNLAKRERSSGTKPMSDTGLDSLSIQRPSHHHRTQSHNPRGRLSRDRAQHEDNEWLLRAGLALATSTREEKGQSWLVKRESSTSLVSDLNQGSDRRPYLPHSQTARRYRSAVSTPVALSRRGSKSQVASPHSSRASFLTAADGVFSRRSGEQTPSHHQAEFVPDFVDHSIRDEMRSIMSQGHNNHHNSPRVDNGNKNIETPSFDYNSRRSSVFDRTFSHPETESSSSESDEESEFGEVEMQRLTRQQGFGLGPWVDRLVEWTLFRVDEESSSAADRHWTDEHDALVGNSTPRKETAITFIEDQSDSEGDMDCQSADIAGDSLPPGSSEGPGKQGGWADVTWLLRAARNAF